MEDTRKKATINCGGAIILNRDLGELGAFAGGMINAGSLLASREAYQNLLAQGFSMNTGSTSIVEFKGKALIYEDGKQLLSANEADLKGNFIVVKGDLILPATKAPNLSQIDGLYVMNTLYHPQSLPLAHINGLKSTKTKSYPDESIFMDNDNVELDETLFSKLNNDTTYVVKGTLAVTDPSLSQIKDSRGIRFVAEDLTIREEYLAAFGDIDAKKRTVIPQGYALIQNDIILNATTHAIYGDKLYIMGDFLIQPKGTDYLNMFSSIIVDGSAQLTIHAVALFRKIGKASEIKVFEGELMQANGRILYSHDVLAGLKQAGIQYTLWINGYLTFDETVDSEDLDAFISISCNGLVAASPASMGAVQQKLDSLNGQLLPYVKGHTYEQDLIENAKMINTGALIII